MASGARTLVLSRWRTSGQSSFDLVREFTQEMPTTTAADAWQRAVTLTSESRLKLEAEPRIEHAQIDEHPKGQPPVFLGGLHAGRQRQPAAETRAPTPGRREKTAQARGQELG